MSSYSSPSEDEEGGQDTSAAAPIEDGVDQTQSDSPTDHNAERGGEGNQVKHGEVDDEDSLRHVDNEGEVIGRRNDDLPTENLTTPPTN